MVTKLPELLRKKRGRGLVPDRSQSVRDVSILLNATGLRKSPGIGYTRAWVAALSGRFCSLFCGPCRHKSGQAWDRTLAVIVFEYSIGFRRSGMTAFTCVICAWSFYRPFVMRPHGVSEQSGILWLNVANLVKQDESRPAFILAALRQPCYRPGRRGQV
ncbi:hypothetical protein [Paraburkholderia rhynchosiae]|nr:hypothetical protein [Paraburkholderia rhynchosiae]CAB3635827.1 hypothetical protein LMG27174_00008 [Paraburkholderia rhynchosiae]